MVNNSHQERESSENFLEKKEKKKKSIKIPVNSRLFLHYASGYEQDAGIRSQFPSVESYLAEIYRKGLTPMWLVPLTPEDVILELDMKKNKLPEEFSNRVYAAAEAGVKFKHDGKNKPVDSVTAGQQNEIYSSAKAATGQLEPATLQEERLPVADNAARQPEINGGDKAGLSEKVSQPSTVVSKEPQKTAEQTEQASRITNPEYQEAFNMLKAGRVEGGPDVSLVRAAISKYDEAMRRNNQEPSLDAKIWLIVEAWPDTDFPSERMLGFLRRKADELASQYRKLKNAPGEEEDYIINGLIEFVSLKALEEGVAYSVEKHGDRRFSPGQNTKEPEPISTYDQARSYLGLPPVKTPAQGEEKKFEKTPSAEQVEGAVSPVVQAGEIVKEELPVEMPADTGGALVSAGHWEKAKNELEFEGRFELAKTRFKGAIFIVQGQADLLERSLSAIESDEYKRSEKELQDLLPLPKVEDVVQQDKPDKNIVTQTVLGYLREQFQKALIRRDVFVARAAAMESNKNASPEEGVLYNTASHPSLPTAGVYSEVSEKPVHRLGVYGEPSTQHNAPVEDSVAEARFPNFERGKKILAENDDVKFEITVGTFDSESGLWNVQLAVREKSTKRSTDQPARMTPEQIEQFIKGFPPSFHSISEFNDQNLAGRIFSEVPGVSPPEPEPDPEITRRIFSAPTVDPKRAVLPNNAADFAGRQPHEITEEGELYPNQIREALLNNEEFVREVRQQWEEALRSNLKNSNPRYTDEILDTIMPGIAQAEFPGFLNAVIDQHLREEGLLGAGVDDQLHANTDSVTDTAAGGLRMESAVTPDAAILPAVPDTESHEKQIFNTLLSRLENGRQDIHGLVEHGDFINALFRLLNLYNSISDFSSTYSDSELESAVGGQNVERFDRAVQELEKEFYGNFDRVDFNIDKFNDAVMFGRAKEGFLKGKIRALSRGSLEEARNWERAFNSFDYHVSENSTQEVRETYEQAKQKEAELVEEANNLEAILPGAEFEVQGSGGLFKKTYTFTIGEELPGHSDFRTVAAVSGGKKKQYTLNTQTLRELRHGVKKFDGKSESPET